MIRVIMLLALALVAGCAPDAFRRDTEFEAWIGQVRRACEHSRIGAAQVGQLLGSTGSREGAYFFNQTSRLYAGQLTPDQWTVNVVPFLNGRRNDPGIQCVLNQLPKK
jgi:hypothetical protein